MTMNSIRFRRLLGLACVGLCSAGAGGCRAADDRVGKAPIDDAAEALVIVPPAGSFQTTLGVSLPSGISTYSGLHPVTFGVPFPANTLGMTHRLRIVNANGDILQAAFDRKTRWDSNYVKWVQVDLALPVVNGTVVPMYLQYGPTVPVTAAPANPVTVVPVASGWNITTLSGSTFTIQPTFSSVGSFTLRKNVDGFETDFVTEAAQTVVENEVGDIDMPAIVDPTNQIRATIKVSGLYRSATGDVASEFITRYRFHSGSRLVRIEHTLTRAKAEKGKITSLTFVPNTSPGGSVQHAVDGSVITSPSAFERRQVEWNRVSDQNDLGVGKSLDGWLQQKTASRSQFIGLRWPWQQFPTRLGAFVVGGNLRPRVHLIGPATPMSLEAKDVVIPPLAFYHDGNIDIQKGKDGYVGVGGWSPTGVAKTWDLAVWDVPTSDVAFNLTPAVKNTLLQHPIYVYVDPAFAVKAGLPGPNAARHAAGASGTIDTALDAVFDWMTRERADEYDYGVWNFGDIQYGWNPAAWDAYGVTSPSYRYWNNNGKGWGVIPWMLYLRSGDRKYVERAEAHSRHVMDVDTSHVDDFPIAKHKGGTYSYAPIHFGSANSPADISNDSEYLSYAYHLLGMDRAKDVILERQHALLTSNGSFTSIADTKDLLDYLEGPPNPLIFEPRLRCTREAFNTFGELALVHEETHHPDLLPLADRFLTAFEKCQAANGFLPGVKTAEWFSRSFLVAARSFPTLKSRVMKVLQAWEEHMGMRDKPSPTGQVSGPTDLWTLFALEQAFGGTVYANAIVGHAIAGAMSVNTDFTSTSSDATRWRGLSLLEGNITAGVLRDWMVAQARLTAPNPPAATPSGMAYFAGQLPAEVRYCSDDLTTTRNVVYVRESTDTEFEVKLDFYGPNMGLGGALRIRVYPPDATLTSAPIQDIDTVFENIRVDNVSWALTETLDDIAGYDKAKTITVPPDGKRGVYAIEVISRGTNKPLPMAVTSALGKIVHYIPPYAERLAFFQNNIQFCPLQVPLCGSAVEPDASLPQNACSHTLWRIYATLGFVTSSAHSGAAWFQPSANTALDFVFADNATQEPGFNLTEYSSAPKMRIFDTSGERCKTAISGTAVGETPMGTHCTFTTSSHPSLHHGVWINDTFRMSAVNGSRFYAASESEWFDPSSVPHPPTERFLTPETP